MVKLTELRQNRARVFAGRLVNRGLIGTNAICARWFLRPRCGLAVPSPSDVPSLATRATPISPALRAGSGAGDEASMACVGRGVTVAMGVVFFRSAFARRGSGDPRYSRPGGRRYKLLRRANSARRGVVRGVRAIPHLKSEMWGTHFLVRLRSRIPGDRLAALFFAAGFSHLLLQCVEELACVLR